MTSRNPKRISEKEVGKGQVVQPNGTSWDRFVRQVEQGQGVSRMGGTGCDWNRGVFRLVGTGYNKEQFSF